MFVSLPLASLFANTRLKTERQRLLAPNDPLRDHAYSNGAFGATSHHHPVPDPQALLHEREYLERLVAQTSDNLIDIFAPPMLTPHSAASATPNSRGEWYRSVLNKTSPPGDGPEMPVVLDPSVVGSAEREWLDMVLRGGEEALREVGRVKSVGKLVVGLDY